MVCPRLHCRCQLGEDLIDASLGVILKLHFVKIDVYLTFWLQFRFIMIAREEIQMSEDTKSSTAIGAAGALVTAGTAASTASAVIGGSAATIMSATAGTTGAALASAAGASGLAGGAAISSGMAAVGSAVGGGMAAGAIITAAAPIAAIAAIGYGLFKLFED